MFRILKKKSELEKLNTQYDALLKESFDLSKVNRSESDKKQAEANEILNRIESLLATKET